MFAEKAARCPGCAGPAGAFGGLSDTVPSGESSSREILTERLAGDLRIKIEKQKHRHLPPGSGTGR